MLSYDSLVAHTVERGMPAGQLRGAAREYLHILALKALYGRRGAQGLLFLGGTALRLGHGLPRFSEDLDFDAPGLRLKDWRMLLEETGHELELQGLRVEARGSERGSLLVGELRCSGFLQAYGLADGPGEKLRIKVEANRPEYPVEREPRVVSGYGETAAVVFASAALITSEKILALLNRGLGRDVYDLFFAAGRRWKPDGRVLAARGVPQNPTGAILARVEAIGDRRLAERARKLEPFLFEPAQAKLVAQARSLLPSALEYLTR